MPTAADPKPAPAPTISYASDPEGYVPGVCNIGPWEIRRRRAFGVAGLVIAGILLAILVVAGVPAPMRLLVLLPAWGGVLSWLQARRRFCAAFAMAGLSNFEDGDAGRRAVADAAARRADLQATWRLMRDSFLIGLALTVVAVLLPF